MMKELIFKNDPYEMNWVRPDFPYGEVGVPEELSATSAVSGRAMWSGRRSGSKMKGKSLILQI